MFDPIRPKRPTIGVLAGWQVYAGTLDSFISNVIRGVQAAARQMDWNLLIGCGVIQSGLHDSSIRPAWPIQAPGVDFIPVGPWNCDGILAIPPFHHEAGLPYFLDLQSKGFPVVFTGDWEAGPGAVVDNLNGVKQAVFHLVEHGHQQIAFIAGRNRSVEGDSMSRLKGYQQGLMEAGLAYDPHLVEFGLHNEWGGYEALNRLLVKKRPFTALIASNDQSAIGAIAALREAGLQVPHDVAVIGFDDRLEGRAHIPSLTTVHYPMYEMGYRTAEVLQGILQDGWKNPPVVRVPTHLLIRESCGCMPGDEDLWKTSLGEAQPVYLYSNFNGDIKEKTAAEICGTLFYNMGRVGLRDIELLSRRLTANFTTSLERKDSALFRRSLQQILEYVALQDEDLHACQRAIGILRQRLPEMPECRFPDRFKFAVDMLDQARVLISELTRREASRLMVTNAQQAEITAQMSAHFSTAANEIELVEIFNRFIPQLGIKHAEVFFFEADGEDAYAWSRQAGGPNAKGIERRFVTRQYPPPGLYPESEPVNLVLLPLQTSQGSIGYMAFDGSRLELYAMIMSQFMAALNGIQLYQAAVRSRKEAEEANRLKSSFLSMVSHELRTPLNLISGISNMLLREREAKAGESARVNWDDLERIYISAQHLDGLIRDVIELGSLDVGNVSLAMEPMDLVEVLDSVTVIGKQLTRDKGLEWISEYPRNLPWVLGDRTRLRQVILNLVTNAVKFTTHGHVMLATYQEGHSLTVAVSDTGLGVPPEEQEFIFDEFRQSSRTTARGFGGFGLGLSICRRLVEMHGGKLAVCSSGNEGEGSMFFFSLPFIEKPIPLDQATESLEQAQQVLILAKNEIGGRSLESDLKQRGINAVLQSSGDVNQWRDWIFHGRPDAVILDRALTAEHGWELLKHIKSKPSTASIPVFFYTLDDIEEGCGSLLEMDYMTKPVDAAVLTETLMNMDLQKSGGDENDLFREKTVLIVDDDPGILELHSRIVKAQSHFNRVIQAQSGRQALHYIHQESPDLILLDLMMPDMDGFAVLEAIREKDASRNIPVVVVTGQTLSEEDMLRLNQGVVSVLGKGMFNRQETLDALSAAVTHSRRPGTEVQRLVLKAMAFIHTHYQDPISRSDMAAYVGVSERHLARCFQAEIGLTPITYLNRFRVKVAKALLDDGQLSITEVALEAGFSSGGYFTRVFREEVGISPRTYLQSKCAVRA